MAIPAATYAQMNIEGIINVEDLIEFDKDSLQTLADNLRRPPGRVPAPAGPAPPGGLPPPPPGGTIPTPAFVFGMRSQNRLLAASNLIKYYETTNRPLTAGNIQWNPIIKNFDIQWKALKSKRDEDTPDVQKISKALPVIKWTEAFRDFLARVYGVRYIPLSYVIRETVQVPAAAPLLANNQPHSTEHGSVEAELVARASHEHPLYRDDNASLYHYLEEATRATSYAASIKPFQRGKNGRGAWLALVGQYAGQDKWEAEIRKQEQLLHTRQWKGQSNYSLEAFISSHRNAYVSMEACSQHVTYQLPNQHTRVGYLLDAIQCADAGLQAAMASVRTDTGPTGMRNDFEATAAHLLPYDPVAKKRAAGSKRGIAHISDATGANPPANVAASTSGKQSIGKTGVHLRWHTFEEYRNLTKAQREELYAWREANPKAVAASKERIKKQQKKGGGGRGNSKYLTKKEVSEMIAKRQKAEEQEAKEQNEGEAYIMSLIQKAMDSNGNVSATSSAPAAAKESTGKGALKSILKRAAKNGKF